MIPSQQQFFRWDDLGFGIRTEIIRIIRHPHDYFNYEVEFMLEDDEQGRIFYVPQRNFTEWLKNRDIPVTFNLEQAIDTAYNFLNVAYSPLTDTFMTFQY